MRTKTNKNNFNFMVMAVFATGMLSACSGQSTPTMMNVSPIELVHETVVEQVPLKHLNDGTLTALAQQYHAYGRGNVDLTMTYDPVSKDFTAMKAIHELKRVQATLKKKGVHNVTAQTLAVPDGQASLMVSFDIVRAQAPTGCGVMPGLNNNETSRFLGDYKFGCGIESLLAKQIARPSDLEGTSDMGSRSARRDSIMLEGYSAGVQRTPLEGIDRSDI